MREYKFRAWLEVTTDKRYEFAHKKVKSRFDRIRISTLEYERYHALRDSYYNKMYKKWDMENSESNRLTKSYLMSDGYGFGDLVRLTELQMDCVTVDIMQYTGIKDKNGKKIYEKDVVMSGCLVGDVWKESLGIVEWDNEYAMFVVRLYDCDVEQMLDVPCTVVGNVYEGWVV